MKEKIVITKDSDIFAVATEILRPSIEELLGRVAKRFALVVAIIDPTKRPGTHSFDEAVLRIISFGMDEKMSKYQKFALLKARQAWEHGSSNLLIQELSPALIKPGEVLYYGGVNHFGQVVGSSGVESYFDQLISLWYASTIQALAKHRLEIIKAGPDFQGTLE